MSSFFWATVTQVSPLRIKIDGDTAALLITPDTLVNTGELIVGSRVRCELSDNKITVLGQAGGETIPPDGYRFRQTLYFTSSGVFSKASYPWLRAVRVKLVGAGGAGGGTGATGGAPNVSFGQGGGGGGYAEKFILASALATGETVTVGAGGTGVVGPGNGGGTTSFSAHVVATGGSGGPRKVADVYGSYMNTAPGGVGTAGDLLIAGSSGGAGQNADAGLASSGPGGSSQLGGGGYALGWGGSPYSAAGMPGGNYGGGGGGGLSNSSSAQNVGGAGAPGIVIVEMYS